MMNKCNRCGDDMPCLCQRNEPTIQGESKALPLKHPDGSTVQAGDLVAGQAYELDNTGTLLPLTTEEQAREDALTRTINQIEEECAAAVKAWQSRDVNTPELKRRIYQTIQLEYLRRDVCIATAIWQTDCGLTSAQEICEILATIGGEFLKNGIRLVMDRPIELRGHIVRQLLAGYVKDLVKDGLIPAAPPQQATPPILGADGKPIRRKMH